jgi:hypothetical protein
MPSGRPSSSGSRSGSAGGGPGPAARVPAAAPRAANPRAVREAYYLQRTRFERIAAQKLRRRQLTEDGNVEISGRDLRERSR